MVKKIFHLVKITVLIFFIAVTASASELDSTFGVDGRVAIEIGTHGDRAQAIAIQPDGKILLGGSSTDGDSLGYSLIRLLADGSPDPAFNGDGTCLLDLSSGDDEILALGLSSDGQILAGGYINNGVDRDFALLRFNSDGTLDTDFGDQGKVITSVGNSDDEITALVVDNDGSVLVAGSAAGTRGRVIVLARYLADGNLDVTFADQGLSLIGIGKDVLAQGMVVDKDGRIIISGSYTDGDTTRMMLAGFTLDGIIDDGFGEKGIATTHYAQNVSEGYGIFQEQDGAIIVAGSVGLEGERAAALFSFTAQGVSDTSFGEDGALITEIGPEDDVLYGLAGNANSLNAAGFTTTNSNRDFLLITYDKKRVDKQSEGDLPAAWTTEDVGIFHIGELEVEDSFTTFESDSAAEKDQLQAEVMSTSFGQGEAVSYAIAMQDDGKVVIVGTAGDNGMSSAVVSRYTVNDSWVATTNSAFVPYNVNIDTLIPSEIIATGAYSGGNINPGLGTVTQRGVVYSIAPYPVCKSDCASGGSGDGGGGNGGNTGAPNVSNPQPTGSINTTSTTLEVTTDVNATCKYTDSNAGMDYNNMQKDFDTTGGTLHQEPAGPLVDGTYTYWVRCKNTATDVANTSDTVISFTVDTSLSGNIMNSAAGILVTDATEKIGNFLVSSAYAQDTSTTTTTSSTSFIKKEGYTNDGAGSGLYSSIMDELTPDTRYYVRAYAIVDDKIYYGPQVDFETASACFIATAAYGSILHPAVAVLRDFRDQYLKTNSFGRYLVAWYYKNSPPIADRIAASSSLRFVTRLILVPVIAFGWALLHPGTTGMFFCVVCFFVMLFRLRRHHFVTPST